MANPERLELLNEGRKAFNQWRQENKEATMDLSGADLSKRDLQEFNLHKADLSGANLAGADLRKANLTAVNLESANLEGANIEATNLQQSNLIGAKCRKINGREAHLTHTKIDNADFSHAFLKSAHLSQAVGRSVNFSKATLREAEIEGGILPYANFAGANLAYSKLDNATLTGSDWDGATFFEARFSGTQLDGVRNAHKAISLDKTHVPSGVKYFENCERDWINKWVDWEHIRSFGSFPLFGVSYSVLGVLLVALNLIGLYNQKIEVAREWAAGAIESGDQPTQALANQIVSRVNIYEIEWSTVALLCSTSILLLASIIYGLGCPSEIKDFSRSQWLYQNNRSLLHYWPLSWKYRKWRIACGLAYVFGGGLTLILLFIKAWGALAAVWRYTG